MAKGDSRRTIRDCASLSAGQGTLLLETLAKGAARGQELRRRKTDGELTSLYSSPRTIEHRRHPANYFRPAADTMGGLRDRAITDYAFNCRNRRAVKIAL